MVKYQQKDLIYPVMNNKNIQPQFYKNSIHLDQQYHQLNRKAI